MHIFAGSFNINTGKARLSFRQPHDRSVLYLLCGRIQDHVLFIQSGIQSHPAVVLIRNLYAELFHILLHPLYAFPLLDHINKVSVVHRVHGGRRNTA